VPSLRAPSAQATAQQPPVKGMVWVVGDWCECHTLRRRVADKIPAIDLIWNALAD